MSATLYLLFQNRLQYNSIEAFQQVLSHRVNAPIRLLKDFEEDLTNHYFFRPHIASDKTKLDVFYGRRLHFNNYAQFIVVNLNEDEYFNTSTAALTGDDLDEKLQSLTHLLNTIDKAKQLFDASEYWLMGSNELDYILATDSIVSHEAVNHTLGRSCYNIIDFHHQRCAPEKFMRQHYAYLFLNQQSVDEIRYERLQLKYQLDQDIRHNSIHFTPNFSKTKNPPQIPNLTGHAEKLQLQLKDLVQNSDLDSIQKVALNWYLNKVNQSLNTLQFDSDYYRQFVHEDGYQHFGDYIVASQDAETHVFLHNGQFLFSTPLEIMPINHSIAWLNRFIFTRNRATAELSILTPKGNAAIPPFQGKIEYFSFETPHQNWRFCVYRFGLNYGFLFLNDISNSRRTKPKYTMMEVIQKTEQFRKIDIGIEATEVDGTSVLFNAKGVEVQNL